MAYLSKFKIRCLILTGIISILIAHNSYGHTYKKMNVEIIHPWCSAGVAGDNTFCNITISNDSDKDVELIGIDSDSVHHIMLMKNGKSVDKILIIFPKTRSFEDLCPVLQKMVGKTKIYSVDKI